MESSIQIKQGNISKRDPKVTKKTRHALETGQTMSAESKLSPQKHISTEKVESNPYARYENVALKPEVKELKPVVRQRIMYHRLFTPVRIRTNTPVCQTTKETATQVSDVNSERAAVGMPICKDRVETCVFCRMESPMGKNHSTWCQKLFSLNEIYNQYNRDVCSRQRQRKPLAKIGPLEGKHKNLLHVRNLPRNVRRTAPSPTSPPPTPAVIPGSHAYKEYLRTLDEPSPMTKLRTLPEGNFTEQKRDATSTCYLPNIDNRAIEGYMFRPRPLLRHREITVSPALGTEFLVEKLGLKFRLPNVNNNWPETKTKKVKTPRPFFGQHELALPPVMWRSTATHLHVHS